MLRWKVRMERHRIPYSIKIGVMRWQSKSVLNASWSKIFAEKKNDGGIFYVYKNDEVDEER